MGSNFESCVWRAVSSQSSHHPQEVLLAQFSLYVHKGGLKPDSFHFIFPPTCESQYCGEPPWPRGSVLDLRPPVLEFRILCLEEVSSHSSHHPQDVLLAQFSLYVHKSGLKPDSFHFSPPVPDVSYSRQSHYVQSSTIVYECSARSITLVT